MSSSREQSPSIPRMNLGGLESREASNARQSASAAREKASESAAKTESQAREALSAARPSAGSAQAREALSAARPSAGSAQARGTADSQAREALSAARPSAGSAQARGTTDSQPREALSAARPSAGSAQARGTADSQAREALSAARPSASAARESVRSGTASQVRDSKPTPSEARPSTATTAVRSSARPPIPAGPRAPANKRGEPDFTGPTPKVETDFAKQSYAGFAPDVTKFLKEVNASRDGIVQLRVLPKTQQMQQLLLQESTIREVTVKQEQSAFAQIAHKRAEDLAKREEQDLVKANKEKVEALKQRQQEEVASAKEDALSKAKTIEAEIKEKLATVAKLQPRLGVPAAVLADLKDDSNDTAVLGNLLEEDKKLQKVLKADARFSKSRTAETDGGAFPYWLKQCIASSFNVAAIVKRSPLRAAVEDADVNTKVAADKKLVVVRDAQSKVVAWVSARGGTDVVPLAEAYLAEPPKPAGLPAAAGQGVAWCKEDLADAQRKAKAANSTIVGIEAVSVGAITVDGIASAELSRKDIVSLGEAASA